MGKTMEDPLLQHIKRREQEREQEVVERENESEIRKEKVKNVVSVAVPMVIVSISQYLFQFSSIMIIGHHGELALAGVSLANSFANLTGFSIIFGMAIALETLCGQAFGAKQYQKLGPYACASMISILIVCCPISVLWLFMKPLLKLFHQDPQVLEVASEYCVWLIPALFGFAISQSLIRYSQSQRLALPMVISTSVSTCFNAVACWFFVNTLGFGPKGAAIAGSFGYWLNVTILWFLTKNSRSSQETQIQLSDEAISHIKTFFKLAVPSTLMISLEWWAYEAMVLLSGLLPNAKLETSALSMIFTTSTLNYNLVNAIGAAASTTVANELGAGDPMAARTSSNIAIAIAATESALVSATLFFSRHSWWYVFSGVEEVVSYAEKITPFLCASLIIHSFSATLCGTVRGRGKQHIGAYANVVAYYVVGMPLSILLCFTLHLKAKGLWIGAASGTAVQCLILFFSVRFTNWSKEASDARDKIFQKEDWVPASEVV